jgi:hypothetical protein
MAVYFSFLRRLYRHFGETSKSGRLLDRVILSKKLPIRFLISIGENYTLAINNLKTFIRNYMPGIFRFLRKILKR